MKEVFELLIHFIVTLCKLSAPGGVKALIAENHIEAAACCDESWQE